MIPKNKCKKEIPRVAENNVEVKYYLELKDGEKLYIDEFTESYGQNRVDKERESIQSEITKVEEYDKTKETATLQEKLTNLQEIEDRLKEKEK